jgi:ABC-type Fe3+ transport system permease subunit
MIVESLGVAAVSGILVASLSLIAAWLAMGSRWFFATVVVLMAVAWTLPAPLAGLGLKETIKGLLDVTSSEALGIILYYGPSPAPVVWANIVRFFPFGIAILWLRIRLLPKELFETARLEGAGPGHVLRWIVWPLSRSEFIKAALAVAVLSLGELGAGKLVQTPGPRIFAHEIFEEMHSGVTNELAALCLVLLGLVVMGGGTLAWFGHKITSPPI